ncbi:hypothetical protein [Adhaeribacter aquaticus]|uniref:hypothetical protein n=1 Tax=Adhaeribacter aquaticus TaxID=299567 RepID=UPI00040602C9|nr:hypothetical protein [Adhaeribacter aquaticus]
MKILSEKIKTIGLAFLIGVSVSMGACSTGTSEGEVSVEESDAKDKDPTEHNVNGKSSAQISTDTVDMDNAYERTDGDKGVHDRDNDGMADKK